MKPVKFSPWPQGLASEHLLCRSRLRVAEVKSPTSRTKQRTGKRTVPLILPRSRQSPSRQARARSRGRLLYNGNPPKEERTKQITDNPQCKECPPPTDWSAKA